jgi:hypothetical protein
LGIRIDAIDLPRTHVAGHLSRFARLNELHRLDSANGRHIAAVVRRYVRFLLAGPVAAMLYLERAQGYRPFSPHRSGFRERILKRQFLSNDPDLDVAYALVLAWICNDVRGCFCKEVRPPQGAHFRDQWTRTVELLECVTLWRRVERLALRLLRQNCLQEDAAP